MINLLSVVLMGSYNYLSGSSGLKSEVNTDLINVAQSSLNNAQNFGNGAGFDFDNTVVTQDVDAFESYDNVLSVSTSILVNSNVDTPSIIIPSLFTNHTTSTAYDFSPCELQVTYKPNTLVQSWTDTPAEALKFDTAIPDFSVDDEAEDLKLPLSQYPLATLLI